MIGKQFQKNKQPRQVWLYRNVFYSRVSATAVFCLLISFILQPFERSFAAEINSEIVMQTETITNLAVDAMLVNETADAPETATASEVQSDSTADEPLQSLENDPTDTELVSTTRDDVVDAELSASESDALVIENATDSSNVGLPVDTGTSGSEPATAENNEATTTVLTDEEIQDLITPADEIPDVSITEVVATTTENTVAILNVYSDATMQFNKSDCVTVEDGSFYCQVAKEVVQEEADGLSALQDIDGDLEIYLRKNGELTQLTFNKVDDAAPYFDSSSNSIVWHRLIDDRYQIIAYSLTTKEEVQLTAESINNMEPSRSGLNTVWQRWNNNNWDVVLYDGTETTFITDSGMHDIAPKIKGDLVMWNRLHPDTTQTIELYDIATKEFTTISDTEGGALSNPRMVLVYETEFENGDIVTKGYDVETGEITPIASKAAEIPDELPEPDATGETRALLPVKNTTEEDSELRDDSIRDQSLNATNTLPVINQGDLVVATTTVAEVITLNPATTTIDRSELTLDLTQPEFSPEEVAMTIAIPAYVAPATSSETTYLENINVATSSSKEIRENVLNEPAP